MRGIDSCILNVSKALRCVNKRRTYLLRKKGPELSWEVVILHTESVPQKRTGCQARGRGGSCSDRRVGQLGDSHQGRGTTSGSVMTDE